MPIQRGQTLQHYRVTDKIGEGGMGVVWRATDTSLNRDVAIKVLPTTVAADAERLARFEREARLLATLNHTNIAGVYGLHEAPGTTPAEPPTRFIAMEFVPGQDLAERLRAGSLPLDQALNIARQITDGLEAAHDAGVVHRDLKPANVRLTAEGKVKLLDFGLAKAAAADPASGDPNLSPTLTSAGTVAGMVLGTAAYMSPEQARGHIADKRADVWAFGAVLWEMLTGRNAFAGKTISDTLAAVLKTEPDWNELRRETPPSVRRLLRRCLEKDPGQRLHDIADARLEIDDAGSIGDDPVERRPLSTRRTAIMAALLLLAGIGAGALISRSLTPDQEATPEPITRSPLAWATEPLVQRTRSKPFASLAPDNRSIVYVDQGQLWVRRLDELESEPLPGTDGGFSPFFSPDSQEVAFFTSGELKRVPLRGGLPRTIAQVPAGLTGSWGADDTIVIGLGGPTGLSRVSANGGELEPLTELGPTEADHDWPQILPGGESVVFTIAPATYNWDEAEIVVQSLTTGERKVLVSGGFYARYASSGHLLYARTGRLMGVPFDPGKPEVTGAPVTVVEDVEQSTFYSGVAQYDLADDGDLLFVRGDYRFPLTTALRVDRDGDESPAMPPGRYNSMSASPDGSKIALHLYADGMPDLYVHDLATGTRNRLTFEPMGRTRPIWSPDGKTLFFASRNRVFSRRADGTGATNTLAEVALRSNKHRLLVSFAPTSVSPGSDLLLGVSQGDDETGSDIAVLEVGSAEPRAIIATAARETSPTFSPDGKWIAYESDESGRSQVYVRPFPDVDRGKWQVSSPSGAAGRPQWSPGGGEIFFSAGSKQFTVPVVGTEPFSVGNASPLFDGRDYTVYFNGSHAIAPDGQSFLVFENWNDPDESVELILVQNWLDELERLVPTN